jgi:hypothetical protein
VGKTQVRSSAPRDQRTAFTYIFGVLCVKDGKGAALILPACNTEAMNLHLAEIAETVAPDRSVASDDHQQFLDRPADKIRSTIANTDSTVMARMQTLSLQAVLR